MLAYFFKMDKRPNSTKQPVLTEGHQVNVELKDETSFTNPTLKISNEIVFGQFSPDIYNYIFIPYWNRFYYINDWVYMLGIWECTCIVDVLASFKTQIGSTSAYIIRSSHSSDGDIIDAFYPATTKKTITKLAVNSEIYHTSIPSGCYVIGVINKTNSPIRVGAVTYYAVDQNTLSAILAYLFSSAIYSAEGITEISSGLFKSMFNPFQYLVSCMWFPYPLSTYGNPATDETDITVGYWATNFRGMLVRNVVHDAHFHSSTAIPPHPQSARGNFLNKEPFTRLTLFYPPFGEIPIDTTFCQYQNNYLSGIINIDFITGLANCYITITDGYDSSTTADYNKYSVLRSAQIGVPIQLAQIYTDYISTAGSIGGIIAGIVTRGIGAIFENIMSGVESAQPKLTTQGSNGSFLEIIEAPYLIIEHSRIVDDNNSEFGRPLCATRTISAIPGYIQCGEADHHFSGTRGENVEINQYLKNGFFYE